MYVSGPSLGIVSGAVAIVWLVLLYVNGYMTVSGCLWRR